MKKLNSRKKSNNNSLTRQQSAVRGLQSNPKENFYEYNKINNQLNKLIDNFVILKIPNLEASKHVWGYWIFNTFYGILKQKNKLLHQYSFQFNPLNQWRYQENARIPLTGDEDLAFLEEDAVFEHDGLTYEFEFSTKSIAAIVNKNLIIINEEIFAKEIK